MRTMIAAYGALLLFLFPVSGNPRQGSQAGPQQQAGASKKGTHGGDTGGSGGAWHKVPSRGPADAPVTIVEFSDFQCSTCSIMPPILDQVQLRYKDKVRLVFRQAPVPMHPDAAKAAEASLCANEQGRFWEMHDRMFKDQGALGVDDLKSKAATIVGLDMGRFKVCLDSGIEARKVQADLKYGVEMGVSGAPSLLINGHLILGPMSADDLLRIVDTELRRKGKG